MKRIVVLLALVVAMMAAAVLPANATVGLAVGVFQGTATVGVGGTCNAPAGNGLFVPGGIKQNIHGFWKLTTAITGVAAVDQPAPAVDGPTGALNACGELTAVALGIGAACGISKGYNGTGASNIGAIGAALSHLGWVSSAGGTLPVTGNWTAGKAKGTVLALVQAQGGANCVSAISATGASSFTVAGVAALV